MTKEEYKSLSKAKQYLLLKDLGHFLANREYQGFIISLFEFEGFYVELWKRIGHDYIDYIEIVKDSETLQYYLDDFDVSGSLGL
ncbi:MAG: hypothetical protein HKN32_10410 [Flavobacteriales bacterium]|nr:hypothetical protein [Flavobacteriales bacterium]